MRVAALPRCCARSSGRPAATPRTVWPSSQSAACWCENRVKNAQADRRVDVLEQPDHAGEHQLQVRAQLVGQPDPRRDQSRRARHVIRRLTVCVGVRFQRAQPSPVGAQRVGQHERVEPVVLVTGRAVPAAQVLAAAAVRSRTRSARPGAAPRPPGRRRVRSPPRRPRQRSSCRTALRSPAAVCSTVNRSRTVPIRADHRHRVELRARTPDPPRRARSRRRPWFPAVRLDDLPRSLLPRRSAPGGPRARQAGRSLIGARRRVALSPVSARPATTAEPRRTHVGPRRSSEPGSGPMATSGAVRELSPTPAGHRKGWTSERARELTVRHSSIANGPDERSEQGPRGGTQ